MFWSFWTIIRTSDVPKRLVHAADMKTYSCVTWFLTAYLLNITFNLYTEIGKQLITFQLWIWLLFHVV